MNHRIPFNRPHVCGAEYDYIADAVARGHLSGDGHYTGRAHELLRKLSGSEHALLTTSCTHALEMSASLLGIGPGDEVIVPSFTFVSTVNAFAIRGARPAFVDIRPDTLNIDERLIERSITQATKAIVVVHYAGVGCEMNEIRAIASDRGIAVIEDNAHGFGGSYRGQPLGTIGEMSTLSFHETKNLHCGEGGALLTSNDALVERAEILREKGTNRSQFFRGQIDKYTWVDVGSSYLPSDLLAAFLVAQLENFDEIQSTRSAIWDRYDAELGPWAQRCGIAKPTVPAHCEHPSHLYYLLMPDLATRQRFIDHMAANDVQTVFHYVPLHRSPKGLELGGRDAVCPVTEDVSDRLVRLPLFPGLSGDDQTRVIDAATRFLA